MFEFKINRASDLKSALVPLTCLSPTATVINSVKAVSLLHSIPSGRVIAVLQISSTEFDHFNCIEGTSTGIDIKMLIGFLNFLDDENMPLTMGAAVEDNVGRLTVKMRNIGSTPYAFFNMGLIQANDQHINFFHQERTYDVKVGMLSAKFRDIVMDMGQ